MYICHKTRINEHNTAYNRKLIEISAYADHLIKEKHKFNCNFEILHTEIEQPKSLEINRLNRKALSAFLIYRLSMKFCLLSWFRN